MRFAAVIPAAPALLPWLTGGPVAELAPVRGVVRALLGRLAELLADDAARLVVVAPGQVTRRHAVLSDTLSGYGAPDPDPRPGGPAVLPPGLALAINLLREVGGGGTGPGTNLRSPLLMEVATTEAPGVCARLGGELAAEAGPDGIWLVLGDGSARRTPKAPGAFHKGALAFDRAIEAALGEVDLEAIRELDVALAEHLMAAGRAPWQVLAGATPATVPFEAGDCFHEAPLGVGYFTVAWARATDRG